MYRYCWVPIRRRVPAQNYCPAHNDAEALQSCTDLASDLSIAHSTWRWMELQHRNGTAPVWFYYYAQPRPAKRKPAPGDHPDTGAVHSAEIEYALGNLDGNQVYAWTDADRTTSRVMQAYFANFILHGDPNGKDLPSWPALNERHDSPLRQTIDANTHSEVDPHTARHAALQSVIEEEAKAKPGDKLFSVLVVKQQRRELVQIAPPG